MARMLITGIPHPPENELWCAPCLALAKGSVFADPEVQKWVEAGLADDGKDVFTVAADVRKVTKQLALAVSWGPHALMGGAVVPLCVLHFAAIDGSTPPPRAGDGRGQLYRGGR